jgi:hypothetical protein
MRKLLVLLSLFLTHSVLKAQCAGSPVINMSYLQGYTAGNNGFLIATLPSSNAGTYDHLHLTATFNSNDGSDTNSTIDATFGNRGAFRYIYTAKGASPTGNNAHIAAYQQSDGSVNLYFLLQDGYDSGAYTILDQQQECIYASPAAITTNTTPPGTLLFDTASSTYPPANYADLSGNLSILGNVKLTANSGASIIFPDSTVQTTAWNGVLSGGDYAESVNVSGGREEYEPGDVLVIDPTSEGKFLKSSIPYSTAVTGIYSTKPGLVGRRQLSARAHMKEEVPMAMTGIVPTKISTENGPIKPGDLLVTSSKPGYAMKGTDRTQMLGAVIGKAIGHLDSGVGVIEAVVTLQ